MGGDPVNSELLHVRVEGDAPDDAAAQAARGPVLVGLASIGGRSRATLSVSSTQLFAGATELQISHRGAIYRLKQTALGKLILTK